MIEIHASYDGRVIVPDLPLNLPANQRVRVVVEPLPAPAGESAPPLAKRELGLRRGAEPYIADDAFEPLPDEIWSEEEH